METMTVMQQWAMGAGIVFMVVLMLVASVLAVEFGLRSLDRIRNRFRNVPPYIKWKDL